MEVNNAALQVVWRQIPTLIMILAVIMRLANESRQQSRLARSFT